MTGQTWNSESYQRDTGFVSAYGEDVLSWLAPQPGERILDIGCGDGVLTKKLVDLGAETVGIDASASFIESAKETGIDARLMDAQRLTFEDEFDAVFTNAAMHWMLDKPAVIAGVGRALKPNGRFAGEFGGFGNVAALVSTMRAVGDLMGGDPELAQPGEYPTVRAFSKMLEEGGFVVEDITTFYRPTPLPHAVRSWLKVMRGPFFEQFGDREEEAYDHVEKALAPCLRDDQGQWFADYVRLRFRARLA
ncbi:MAG: methyltransferase domain-containing protein [Ahrensia sp.]|nr:methyltransferase domain-containing protein [Ahrensia sp.]